MNRTRVRSVSWHPLNVGWRAPVMQAMRRRARPSLRSSRDIPDGSQSLGPAAHTRLTADRAGAWQSAHRGGGVGTPRAGAARAAHPTAGADTRSGKHASLRACGSAAAPFAGHHCMALGRASNG